MSRLDAQLKLRMHAALRAQVEQAAKVAHCSLNAELIVRFEASFATVKVPVEVPADASAQVSESSAPARLQLLCVLVKSRDGASRSLPVHTMRPMPPRVCAQGKWSLENLPGFHLRETHAQPAPAAVLARGVQLGQAHTLRADPRTLRAGGVSL